MAYSDYQKQNVARLQKITEGCREDMHEPDEQDLKLEFHEGMGFDNAFTNAPSITMKTNAGFWLHRDGFESEWFNLAEIINLARRPFHQRTGTG